MTDKPEADDAAKAQAARDAYDKAKAESDKARAEHAQAPEAEKAKALKKAEDAQAAADKARAEYEKSPERARLRIELALVDAAQPDAMHPEDLPQRRRALIARLTQLGDRFGESQR
jgi:hypothetical protein